VRSAIAGATGASGQRSEFGMRVLHFAHSYIPQYGGTTTRLLNLLADPEHEHLLVVHAPSRHVLPDDVGEVAAQQRYGHIEVRRVDLRKLGPRGRVPLLNVHRQAAALRDAVRNAPVDLVHGHNPTSSALAACGSARRRGVPLVYEVHGIMRNYSNLPRPFGPVTPLNRVVHGIMRGTIGRYERHVLHRADRIIVQTAASQRHLQALYGLADKPFDVIPNGVDVERFDPRRWHAEGQAWRAARGWQDVTVCLYAGYLDHVNGVDQTLAVIPTLPADVRRRLRFVFAGRGPQTDAVRAAAQAHGEIEFLGAVDYEQMPVLMAACDVFMIPRPPVIPAETFRPVKLLEAMAMEKVLLVSDVAAMAELIRHEENGLLFRKGDADSLRTVLGGLADDAAARAPLGVQARQDVRAGHTWDAARRRLDACYAAALGRRPAVVPGAVEPAGAEPS
jgi:glycosyltransferase involved in cell wall biosynthesis